eukprot:2130303-Prymnesium_polylepis.2
MDGEGALQLQSFCTIRAHCSAAGVVRRGAGEPMERSERREVLDMFRCRMCGWHMPRAWLCLLCERGVGCERCTACGSDVTCVMTVSVSGLAFGGL